MILPLDSDLHPKIDKAHWEAANKDRSLQTDLRARCSIEPWFWLVNFVYTIRKDENTGGIASIERFPADSYLQYVFHQLFTVPKLAIDKSRQMRMNWLLSSWILWLVLYRKYEEIICQTKKEEDADMEIIQRAYGIWQRLPQWLGPRIQKHSYAFCRLKVPETNSIIIGIPQGADQIRSHNPTRYFGDEGGFWEGEFEECRTAALACCEDVKLISTANGGEWESFINDKLVA